MMALAGSSMFGRPVVAALPDPVGWGFDQVQGWANDIGDSLFARFASFLGDWALRSAAFSANLVWSLASQATAIDLESQRSTHGMVQSLSIAFFVAVLWWAIGAAAVKGDPGLVARRLFLDAPKVVLGSTALFTVFVTVSGAFGEIEQWVVVSTGSPLGPFDAFQVDALGQPSEVSLLASFLVFVISFFMILVSLALALFLMVRFAAINLLVVFIPLAMVGLMTPYASMARLILEKLAALYLSKIVILISLAVAAGLIGNIPDGGPLYFTSAAPAAPGEPVVDVDEVAVEAARQDDEANAARIVGSMLAGLGVMLVAAFSPVLLFQLIPSAYHDTAPYSGSDVGGLYGGAGPGGGAFTSARRAAGRSRQITRRGRRRR